MSQHYRSNYTTYIFGEHWRGLRKLMFDTFGRDCQACGIEHGIRNVHHMIYREPLESCTVNDLMVLCAPCHDLIHWWEKSKGVSLPRTRPETASLVAQIKRGQQFKQRQEKIEHKKKKRRQRHAGIVTRAAVIPPPRIPVPPHCPKSVLKAFNQMHTGGYKRREIALFLENFGRFLQTIREPMHKGEAFTLMYPSHHPASSGQPF